MKHASQSTSKSISASVFSLDDSGQAVFRLGGEHVWHNAGPLLLLHYYDRQHPRAQFVAVPSGSSRTYGTAGTPSLSATGDLAVRKVGDDDWIAEVVFKPVDIRVTLRIRVAADGFTVRIADEDVVEGMPRLYRMLSIELLPNFGAATTGEKGFLTLPNWSGCQTFFDKDYPREVRQTVYSSNDQWEHMCNMPVFGITREQGTCCGLIASGDFDARLVCRVHWERERLNGVHPDLVYRWEQQDDRIAGPREVRYRFAAPDDASGEGYVFVGKTHRAFLRAERGLKNWEEKAAARPVVLEYADRFFLKIFMAYKDPQADGKGPYHTTCTFGEARQILQTCLDRGMRKITAILVGWGIDGHDGQPPTRFPVDDRLGGEAEMKELIAWCKANDILLGVHDSYGGAYTCSPEFDVADLIRHRTGEYWESIIWSGGQCHITCPAVYIDKHVKRDIPALRKLGVYGHHHLDAVGGFKTCFSKDHPLPLRADYIQKVRELFQISIEQIGSVSTEMPYGQYFDVCDGYFHSYTQLGKWLRACPVGQYFADRTVPLVEVVMHGSANCGEAIDRDETPLLYWLDLGLTPQAEVCARKALAFGIRTYDEIGDRIAAMYEACYGGEGIIPRLGRLTIESRIDLAEGVSRTIYSDGTVVTVNRSAAPFEGLPPKRFAVERGRPEA